MAAKKPTTKTTVKKKPIVAKPAAVKPDDSAQRAALRNKLVKKLNNPDAPMDEKDNSETNEILKNVDSEAD